MNKSFNFLSHLSGPLNKQYKRRRDTQSRFWRCWDHVQDSVVKGNMALISSSSRFITSSVPFLIKFSLVTPEPQTSACWMLQSKSPLSGTSSEGDCTVAWQPPKKIKKRYEEFSSLLTEPWLLRSCMERKEFFLSFWSFCTFYMGKLWSVVCPEWDPCWDQV